MMGVKAKSSSTAHAAQGVVDAEQGQAMDAADDGLWFGDINPGRTNGDVAQSLSAAVAKAAGLKPFPVVATRLIQLLSDPEFEMREVKEAVEHDPALATRLLRVANSALFRSAQPCTSIETAIVRLGAHTVGEIVAGVATMAMFKDETGLGARVRDHCAGVAAIARVLGTGFRLRGVPQLFLCGLLHDVGILLSIQCGDFDYAALPADVLEQADQVHLEERKVLGYDHAVLAAHVLDLWKIPYPVSSVVAWHHQPETATADSAQVGLMVSLLRLADRLEYQLCRDMEPDERFVGELVAQGCCGVPSVQTRDLLELWPALVEAKREVDDLLRG